MFNRNETFVFQYFFVLCPHHLTYYNVSVTFMSKADKREDSTMTRYATNSHADKGNHFIKGDTLVNLLET